MKSSILKIQGLTIGHKVPTRFPGKRIPRGRCGKIEKKCKKLRGNVGLRSKIAGVKSTPPPPGCAPEKEVLKRQTTLAPVSTHDPEKGISGGSVCLLLSSDTQNDALNGWRAAVSKVV